MLETLFDIAHVGNGELFGSSPYPWVWISELIGFLSRFPSRKHTAIADGVTIDETDGPVHILENATIRSGAVIYGPAYIGSRTFVNHGALLRGGCLILDGCSIGHNVEIKHSILLPGATCGHRNYVGDSVLGRNVNMGDGCGIANLPADLETEKTIKVTWDGKWTDTGLRKFGALVGDKTSLGCRSTLNPGTILGMRCLVYPNIAVGGTHPPNTLLMPSGKIISKARE